MKRFLTITIFTLTFAAAIIFNYTNIFTARVAESPKSEATIPQNEAYGKIPLSFEQNRGQTDAQAKFLARGAGYSLFLTETEAVMRLKNSGCEAGELDKTPEKDCQKTSSILRMRFESANRQPQISGASEMKGVSNYLNLDGAGAELSGVPNFERVRYSEIYNGIDLVFYGNERQLEYDFNVQPHSNPGQIKLSFDGAENLSIDDEGNLVAEISSGKNVLFKAPVAYQEVAGERREVAANYSLEGKTVKFQLSEYDETQRLVIDPILQYSTFLGGLQADYAYAAKVNAAGEVYIAGLTGSADFPVANPIQPNIYPDGNADGFLTKFNAAGNGLIFSTYLGGANYQYISAIAFDAANNISIAGVTDSSDARYDIFIGKLNANASALMYPTVYMRSPGLEFAADIAVDGAGNSYVCGTTDGTAFPTTPGVIRPHTNPGYSSVVVRVNSNGSIGYATYIPGDGYYDFASGIVVDAAGNTTITGAKSSFESSTLYGYIIKINPTATALVFPPFTFGETTNTAKMLIDASGSIYVAGTTYSDNFTTTSGVVQPAYGGGYGDGFITKINASGNAVVWSTYLGGIGDDYIVSLAKDSSGGIFVTGKTNVTGDDNIFVAHVNEGATVIDYNAQFGGTRGEEASSIVIDPNDNVYLTGITYSPDFLTTAGALDRSADVPDSYVMKIRPSSSTPTLSVNTVGLAEGSSGTTNARFTVTLAPAAAQNVTVRYQTADGTAEAGEDYTATGGTLTFTPGQTTKTVDVPVLGDTLPEANEFFTLQLINPTNAQTVIPRGRANINNDDATALSIDNVSHTEGNAGTSNAVFTVSLSAASGSAVTVNYATEDAIALAGQDYTAKNGVLNFAPGETSKTISISITGDTLVEGNETFYVNLSNAVNAAIGDDQGLGTINNDDVGGTIKFSVPTVSVNESAASISLTVTRTGGSASDVFVNYATQNGTAISPGDYSSSSGTLNFGASETSKTITIPIIDDATVEGNESFTANLSSPTSGAVLGTPSTVTVTIIDNDVCAYSISSASSNIPATASSGTFGIIATEGCAWTAASGASWITLTSGASGSGNGTVGFTVAANTSVNQRTGTIVAAGKTFTVTQSGTSQIVRKVFDFDGDGKSDLSIFRPSVGQWWYYRSSDGGNYAATFGNSSDKLVPGDFTGDGKTDIAFWRPSTGEWFILRSEDGSYYSYPFGTSGDMPAVGDFDGDGKSDSAVFRPTDTNWYIRRSSDGGVTITQFGANGDAPAAGDYDGDGKTDIAIWRASVGQWWIQRSSNGSVIAFQFGSSTDKAVQGDYTGDGKTDVAIYRPSTGEWFVLRSENQSYYSFPFGTSGDVPAPGDYDGDGKFDATVFRPSNNTWYVQRTTAGTLIQSFGIAGDKPVPNAFVP
ncbi:MAG: Calx-beta domain-containing protein [Pyrinomonadaceae bacterium]